jgi:NAD-dependent deacetylase
MEHYIDKIVEKIRNANYLMAFTGAGMSVESGIPPFRGEHGIWNRYDPQVLEIDYFYRHPEASWKVIKEIFYDFFGKAQPNAGHKVLGMMEQNGLLQCVVTQNIDNLHQEGGSQTVFEFHGNSKYLICTQCGFRKKVDAHDLEVLPPHCSHCQGLLKPDFVFFGEGIPEQAYTHSFVAARQADVVLVIGSLGEVMPAAMIPSEAKRKGAFIIEINPEPSNFTRSVTDLYIPGKAGDVLSKVADKLWPSIS